jgi:predicted DNA-binding transcriptional regulator AlpA
MKSTAELLRWLASAPEGTEVQAAALYRLLVAALDADEAPEPHGPALLAHEPGWRERLWTCPQETRLSIHELSEAIGKSTSWLYKRTGPKATGERIPCRRLAGELEFVAGEIRGWLQDNEEIIEPGRPGIRAA